MFDPDASQDSLKVTDLVDKWGSKDKETVVTVVAPDSSTYTVAVARRGHKIQAKIRDVRYSH